MTSSSTLADSLLVAITRFQETPPPSHDVRGRVNGEVNRLRGRPIQRWLDNIDSNAEGKNTSLKEVLGTKCFENREDGRTLISQTTERSCGEDYRAPIIEFE